MEPYRQERKPWNISGRTTEEVNAILTAARERGLEETCCRWIRSMLDSRLVHTSLMGSSLTAKVVGGCPQGGVLSSLLWNLVVHRLLSVTNDLGLVPLAMLTTL